MCENIKDVFIRDFTNTLLPHLAESDIDKVSTLLTIALADCRMEKEPREVIVRDNYNDRVLKTYLSCIAVEGKSLNTIEAYRWAIQKLSDTINKDFKDMGTYDLRYYLATLKSRGVSNTTIENARSYYSSFFRWLTDEGFIEKNPMAPIKPIKVNSKQKKPFLPSEIDTLRRACKNSKERALLEVALSSGLRRTEIADLRISDINLKTYELRVRHGKGDKFRVSYINELAASWIEKYLLERTDDLDILFLSQVGNKKYTANGIYRKIKTIGERAGVEDVHPHRFRHTMASGLAQKGMAVNELQNILGHADVNTTLRYVHLNQSTVQSSYRRLSN